MTERSATNRCRNPSNDPGGPWCIVAVKKNNSDNNNRSSIDINDGNPDYYTKQYCQIPFCDSPGQCWL